MVFACLSLIFIEGLLGLWIAVLRIELSYIFDCVDGQLARVTKSSAVGGDLDFMMDELKAYLLIVCIGLRGLMWDLHLGGNQVSGPNLLRSRPYVQQ